MTAREEVAFLVGSEHRVAVMRALREESARPCELERELVASRATVQRALSGLADRGWVEKRDGEYRQTGAGLLVFRAYRQLTDVVGTVEDVGSPLSLLDSVTDDLPVTALRTATATTATAKTPHAPLERYASLLREREVDTLRGICPVLSPVFNEVHRPLFDAGVDMELVIDEQTLEAAETTTPDNHATAMSADSFTLFVVEDLDFGLSLFGDTAVVAAYDDQGRFRACLDDDGGPLVTWANDLYERYRNGAHVLETA
ncbi:helix-turn-helix transcriptional regulator [Halomarina oriensis]|uniref:Transcriptional regulator n=1 Tax=Halomarina oriensis TaxID=671145 RepID=A0A6B0GMY4_9EURY|nr:transcriptional regulator [Halomarina oriensis]MWG36030.1 transcriptional regulator [Halomarina oriensis]